MINKRKIMIIILILILIICILIYSWMKIAFDRELVTYPPPTEKPNTIWECQEYDFYFIVPSEADKCSFGELTLDGESIYLEMYWNGRGGMELYALSPIENGYIVPETEQHHIFYWFPSYICKRGVATVTFPQEYFPLWETDEPVTMTFVCQGEIPEVDIYHGIDPIRRMEVIR